MKIKKLLKLCFPSINILALIAVNELDLQGSYYRFSYLFLGVFVLGTTYVYHRFLAD